MAAVLTLARQRAISCCQGEFNNQQGQEVATEGSGVGTEGRTMKATLTISFVKLNKLLPASS